MRGVSEYPSDGNPAPLGAPKIYESRALTIWAVPKLWPEAEFVKTAVGPFENSSLADQVVRDLEARIFPRHDVRILGEPLDMAASGVTSIPNIDFEVSLNRDLRILPIRNTLSMARPLSSPSELLILILLRRSLESEERSSERD